MKNIFALFFILLLASCSTIPDLGLLQQPRADLVATKDEGSNSSYPQQDWWRIYQDQQLNMLIEEGLVNSPTVAEAEARVTKAYALAQQAGASLVPTINANGSVAKYRQSYNNGVPSAFVPQGYQNAANATLNFSYELDFWGKNKDAVTAASSEAQAAKLQVEQAKIIISTSIAAAYARLAYLYRELDVAKESIAVRAKTVELFKKRFKDGLETESSVERAKSNKAMAEADFAALEESISLTCNSIAALMGAKPNRASQINRPNLLNINSFGIPLVIPADLIGRRPDVMASELSLEAAAQRIDVAKTGFYPNINLVGFFGHQSLGDLNSFFNNSSTIGSFGPSIHLPIFNGGLIEGQYRGARADYDAKLAIYEASIIQALHEVADAITSQKALELRTKKTKEALEAAERAYKLANNRYGGGISTYLEVLQAEDNLITNRRAMADIQARAFTLDVALVKALGGGFQPMAKVKG